LKKGERACNAEKMFLFEAFDALVCSGWGGLKNHCQGFDGWGRISDDAFWVGDLSFYLLRMLDILSFYLLRLIDM